MPKSIGQCIYCRSTDDLSDEHGVPYALGGTDVLKDASCARCRDVTSAIERHVLRDVMGPVRAMMGVRTRHKKDRPREFPVAVERSGKRVTEMIPVEDYVGVMPFVERGLPGYLASGQHKLGRPTDHVAIGAKSVMRIANEQFKLASELDTEYLAIDFPLQPQEYGRLIAKIAYCMAVSRIGLNQWKEVFVLPAILGERDDIWQWVGSEGVISSTLAAKPAHGAYHILNFWVERGHVLVSVQLFANGGLPEYLVVIGRVNDALRGLFRSIGVKNA